MLARYVNGLKRGLKDPRWLIYYLQRDLTLNPAFREGIANLLAHALPSSRFFRPSPEAKEMARHLHQDGFASVPNLLNAAELDDILRYLRSKPCYDPRHPEMPGFHDPAQAHKNCFHAYYCGEDVVYTPYLLAIANHPLVLQTSRVSSDASQRSPRFTSGGCSAPMITATRKPIISAGTQAICIAMSMIGRKSSFSSI